jgi:MFS family permease
MVGRNFGLDLVHGKDAKSITALFAYCGIVGAFVQGGPIGKLVKRMGEPKLIAISLLLVGVSLAPIPFIHGQGALSWRILAQREGVAWLELLFALALLAVGSGLTRPPLFGMLSILTPPHEQGETIGVAQSAGSLARIFGPMFAGGLFHLHPAWPYAVCASISFVTGLLAWKSLVRSEATFLAAKTQTGAQA